jgi:signal transduction histidine kinase
MSSPGRGHGGRDPPPHRLISLALELRAAESQVPPEQRSQADQWSRIGQGLTDVIEEVRKISRGLHPAILEEAGWRLPCGH